MLSSSFKFIELTIIDSFSISIKYLKYESDDFNDEDFISSKILNKEDKELFEEFVDDKMLDKIIEGNQY